MLKRKIALLGGTFDPVHLGHTTVASAAVEHLGAEKVLFVPARRSPLKKCFPIASDEDRLNMISLAIEGNDKFDVSDYELRKPGPSYTLETVMHFEEKLGNEISICWLMGADCIDDLPQWYRVEELLDRCDLCTMFRAGCEKPDFEQFELLWGVQQVEKLRRNVIATPLIDISSTEIRSRLCGGEDVSEVLAPAVAKYISGHTLYRLEEPS